jgi:Ca-activated chloride channel family protein
MNHKAITSLFFLLLIIDPSVLAQGGKKYIRQGNKKYENELYQESEILYRKSLDKDQSSYEANFNLGDALYKQEKYEDASRRFSDLTDEKENKTDLGKIYHNLGNSLLKENRIQESIEAYKNALRNNPNDQDTKHNLAYAKNLLRQQQQSQQQQQQQDQNDQEEQDQQKQDQNQQQNQEQEDQRQEQMEQEHQKNQISEEDANRILEALQQDEEKLLEKLKKQKAQARRVTVLKDW